MSSIDLIIGVLAAMTVGLVFYANHLSEVLRAERQKQLQSLPAFLHAAHHVSYQQMLNGVDAAQDGIALMDQQGRIQYANRALWKLYAIEQQEQAKFLFQPWPNLHSHHGQKEIQDHVLPELEKNGYWFGETDLKIHSGAMLRAELSIRRADDGTFIGIVRDVSERYKRRLERENLLAQLYQSQKAEAIGRVLRGLVHDFNNTLSAMGGYAELLLEDLERQSEQHGYALRIFQASQQTRRILDQARMLLPNSKPGKDQRSDIAKELKDIIHDYQWDKKKAAALTCDFNLFKAETLLDVKKLHSLVLHLLENAFEACKTDGSGRVTLALNDYNPGDKGSPRYQSHAPSPQIDRISDGATRLSFGIYNPDYNYVELSVKDNGCGIPFAVMEYIFDPFFTTKKADESTGMGMSIVQSVLKQGEGYMIIDTDEKKGTEITVLLRVVPGSVLTKQTVTELKGSVVLVDDQDNVRSMNKILLERYGFRVFDFMSPYEALDFMEKNPQDFQYVFTDYSMQGLNGFELSEKIYAKFPQIPVYLLTGYEDLGPGLPANIKSVFVKPLNVSNLAQAFASVH